jgi:hypothetical protein
LAARLAISTFTIFATSDGERVRLCRMCRDRVGQSSWTHVIAECTSTSDLREQYGYDMDSRVDLAFVASDDEDLVRLGNYLAACKREMARHERSERIHAR